MHALDHLFQLGAYARANASAPVKRELALAGDTASDLARVLPTASRRGASDGSFAGA